MVETVRGEDQNLLDSCCPQSLCKAKLTVSQHYL